MISPGQNDPSEQLIGEPIVNKHGDVVRLARLATGTVEVAVGMVKARYDEDQVQQLGSGGYDAGVLRIAKTYGQMSASDMLGSSPFASELH